MRHEDPIIEFAHREWEDAERYYRDNELKIAEWIAETKADRPSIAAQLQALVDDDARTYTRIQLEQKLFGLHAKSKKTFSEAVELASIPPLLRTLRNK